MISALSAYCHWGCMQHRSPSAGLARLLLVSLAHDCFWACRATLASPQMLETFTLITGNALPCGDERFVTKGKDRMVSFLKTHHRAACFLCAHKTSACLLQCHWAPTPGETRAWWKGRLVESQALLCRLSWQWARPGHLG